jgi:hypothetical protein
VRRAARYWLIYLMVALLVVAVALGLNNFGAAIAIGVSGVDRRTEIKVATVFGLCDVVMPAMGMLIGTGLAGPLGSAARWAGAGILFVTAVWGSSRHCVAATTPRRSGAGGGCWSAGPR